MTTSGARRSSLKFYERQMKMNFELQKEYKEKQYKSTIKIMKQSIIYLKF